MRVDSTSGMFQNFLMKGVTKKYQEAESKAIDEIGAADVNSNSDGLSEIQRTRVIPTVEYQPYEETWNSHCGIISNSDITKARRTSKPVSDVEYVREMTPEEEMAAFKKEIYDELSQMQSHNTLSNISVNFTEDGFKAMKDNPAYREEVMSMIKRDLGNSYARPCSILITVGKSVNDYSAYSCSVECDSAYWEGSKDSFYTRNKETPEDDDSSVSRTTFLLNQKRLEERRAENERYFAKLDEQGLMRAAHLEKQSIGKKAAELYDIIARHFDGFYEGSTEEPELYTDGIR